MSIDRELNITAKLLVSLSEEQGVYFAIALLYDANYDQERIEKLLPILQKIPGSIKKNFK